MIAIMSIPRAKMIGLKQYEGGEPYFQEDSPTNILNSVAKVANPPQMWWLEGWGGKFDQWLHQKGQIDHLKENPLPIMNKMNMESKKRCP